ncbi:molybdopterin-guanine dinucleotide biosynthesis protein B [Rhizobium sp. G21]|uniref:molybdopterin-guanine dinucleotide biosynthesis protein B n=1 Tax=Rhizobium sp. G21 TaxID=2758439 RepID=UPI001603A029|nr:molybdopterin-guanine dinucleotide biosynthesis protein B [Rhizobium sp. G21]MBB1250892.1 molybdopterin-guanine dinucleotide biosynthesis protein B [Rhizobium sp. G21]
MTKNQPKIFGVTGWKNSGKTGLMVRLVRELTARGYRVSTVKHAHHDCDVDKPGADSHQHREAGAQEVALVSGARVALMQELRGAPEPSLDDILARLAPCDIVLVEGYKREPIPKIETRRRDARSTEPLAPFDPQILAVASDHAPDTDGPPRFDLDDTQGLAEFILRHLELPDTGHGR